MAPRQCPSRTFSNSELKDGQTKLMLVKKEKLSEEEMRKQLEEPPSSASFSRCVMECLQEYKAELSKLKAALWLDISDQTLTLTV